MQPGRPRKILMPAQTFPLCFPSADEYEAWRNQARQGPRPAAALGYCEDCTIEYAVEMRLQERCGRLDVKFDEKGNPILPPRYMESTNPQTLWSRRQREAQAKARE